MYRCRSWSIFEGSIPVASERSGTGAPAARVLGTLGTADILAIMLRRLFDSAAERSTSTLARHCVPARQLQSLKYYTSIRGVLTSIRSVLCASGLFNEHFHRLFSYFRRAACTLLHRHSLVHDGCIEAFTDMRHGASIMLDLCVHCQSTRLLPQTCPARQGAQLPDAWTLSRSV